MFPTTDSAKSAVDVFPPTDNVKDIKPPRSFQGDVTWAEEQSEKHFRSALELIKFIDGALIQADKSKD